MITIDSLTRLGVALNHDRVVMHDHLDGDVPPEAAVKTQFHPKTSLTRMERHPEFALQGGMPCLHHNIVAEGTVNKAEYRELDLKLNVWDKPRAAAANAYFCDPATATRRTSDRRVPVRRDRTDLPGEHPDRLGAQLLGGQRERESAG
ncbi:hypothetical protein C8D88_102718 [Lentzea atacamensis]|uniref:Uncharacterized protein n=1 Tax=Lentzea atacamensis TaxID=531938 RepID=A0A316IQM6_9PSEU|nr:hypothetical protein [Lentzea atacamensis]PWK89445.1 hypothetical protein C8D88_102718 [Lentzea atacamensis]